MFINELTSGMAGQILYDGDGGGGGGSADEGITTLLNDIDKKISNVLSDDVIGSLKSLAKRSKDSEELDPLHKILFNDNYQLRQKVKDAEDKTLGEGKVAVDEDKAKLIQTLEEREISSVEDLEKHFETHNEISGELQQTKQEVKINKAGEVYGTNPKVLSKLLKSDDLSIETGTKKNDDGEEVETVLVVQDDRKVDLKEYAENNWKEFSPSLFNENGGESVNSGRKFVKQGSGGGGGGSSVAEEFLEQRKARTQSGNPLKGKTENKE